MDHVRHLRIVLQRLGENKLNVGQNKNELMATETEFIGLEVGKERICVGDERRRVLSDGPKPKTMSEFRGFWGLLNFFPRLIYKLLVIAAPLTNLTTNANRIRNSNPPYDEAFRELKESLVSSPVMRAADSSWPFRWRIGAGQQAVGGRLTQISDDQWKHAMSYFLKRLTLVQEIYSTNGRKILAFIFFLQSFRCYPEGSEFKVLMENQMVKNFSARPTQAAKKLAGSNWAANLE